MLDASFIEKIVSLAEVSGIEVDGRSYTTAKIYPNLEPEAAPLKMHTLSGLVDFCLDFAAQVGERAQRGLAIPRCRAVPVDHPGGQHRHPRIVVVPVEVVER